jgi:uncharacterized RDD family membrane protein YckC
VADAAVRKSENDTTIISGTMEVDYSGDTKESDDNAGMPEWRRELSERLKAIRQRREQIGALPKPAVQESPPAFMAAQPGTAPTPDKPAERARKQTYPAPVQEKSADPIPQQKILQPVQPTSAEPPNADEFQKIIDEVISRQPVADAAAPPLEISLSAASQEPGEGKLILLSRILSGLIDLICVVLCTGAFILAADIFSGILVLDSMTLLSFSGLFLLIYFLYSLFFLAASNQTLGMMITDLRVVGSDEKRPLIGQLVRRCLGFLVSFFGLGIGLLWSLFDPKSRCFHDRVSHTHVIRIGVFEP